MDTEIEEVMQEIRKVQQQIDDVEGQLKKATTEADVAYWRKKEEHLRKEKEQLREENLLLLKADTSVNRDLLKEFASHKFKRHKMAYTDSIPVDEVGDITLWEHEVESVYVPCTTEHVDTLLDPEREFLADLRYLHLWHIARNKPVNDIVSMKKSRRREQADLERLYYGHAVTIMRAPALGQPEVSVVGEDHTSNDSARGDLRVYVRNMEHPSSLKAVNVASNAGNDVTGISSNKDTFGRLHKINRTKLLKEGAGGTLLCTLLNRIECIWFAKFEYNSECRMIRCQVAPEIPAKGMSPSAQMCPRLDSIIADHPGDEDVMLADLLDPEAPFGFRCLTRYTDTLPHERRANNPCCLYDTWWYTPRYGASKDCC